MNAVETRARLRLEASERALVLFLGGAWRVAQGAAMAGPPGRRFALAGPADHARAEALAQAARPGWQALGAGGRAALLRRAGFRLPALGLPPALGQPTAGAAAALDPGAPRSPALAAALWAGHCPILCLPRPPALWLYARIEALRRADLPPGVLAVLHVAPNGPQAPGEAA